MTDDAAARTRVSRRTLLGAAAWSVPVVAVAVATPLHAASQLAIDASGVVLEFTDTDIANGAGGSSTFRLSGQVALPAAPASAVPMSATITWQGTGANAGSTGLYLYSNATPTTAGRIDGWTLVQGAADDSLHDTYIFQTTLAGGVAQATTVSRYDDDPSQGFMYGAETAVGGLFYDGIITIRFSAPGYTDAVLTVPFDQPQPG
ncbi:hypothetical protein [Microbacterium sp. EST19A]|uniref:hypothetical protein n=1 Tax=Microbacterium sp. EST19A TaxID=2862681 RepID=UPI001CBD81D8|nr:hypothetical protein [Microbacterium sp. EST19A]